MPVFGYGGFLPFALEIFAMCSFLKFIRKNIRAKPALKLAAVVFILVFSAFSFYLIDAFTLVQ
jgi:hypothetical protein